MGWMHSCRQAAELMTRAVDEPLGLVDRARLRFHLSLCGDCVNVQRQLAALESATAELFAQGPGDEPAPRG
jgi:hypothetical protein